MSYGYEIKYHEWVSNVKLKMEGGEEINFQIDAFYPSYNLVKLLDSNPYGVESSPKPRMTDFVDCKEDGEPVKAYVFRVDKIESAEINYRKKTKVLDNLGTV